MLLKGIDWLAEMLERDRNPDLPRDGLFICFTNNGQITIHTRRVKSSNLLASTKIFNHSQKLHPHHNPAIAINEIGDEQVVAGT